MKLAFVVLLAATPMFANTPPATPKAAPKPPVVSAELKAKFFKAESQAQSAQADAERAGQLLQEKQKVLNESINALQKTCGDNFTLQLDKEGDPVCVAKPEPPKPVEPAKTPETPKK